MESDIHIVRRAARDASVPDLLEADAYLFCAPENLATVSGEMLEFFHRCFYQAMDEDENSMLLGRPYGLAIAAGSDGSNAARQIERICTGWRLRPCADTFINRSTQPQTKQAILQPKECEPHTRQRCTEIGGLVAATVLLSES